MRINPDYDFDLRITAPDNLMRYLETYVSNDTLVVREKNNDIDHGGVLVEISENYLDRIELNGSGLIIAEDTIYSSNLKIEIDGSGRIEAWGEAEEVRSAIFGSGLIASRSIESSIPEARIEGSGNIDIYASFSLFARIDGSGVVRYWDNPETIDSNVDGSGAIIEIN